MQAPMQAVQVQCAGCRSRLNVPPTLHEFSCPKCQLEQTLPQQLRHTQSLQIPCVNCRALLNVPAGLITFACPACQASLSLNTAAMPGLLAARTNNPPAAAPKQMVGPGDEENRPLATQYNAQASQDTVAASKTPLPGNPEGVNEIALQAEAEEDEEKPAEETFTAHRSPAYSYGSPHPTPVLESISLSAVDLPAPTYTPVVLPLVAQALSGLQLETVVYACQRHQQQLEGGLRAGFLIGDQGGSGTGRTLAGLVLENFKLGKTRVLWFALGSDMMNVLRRDLDDTGALEVPLHDLSSLPYNRLESKAVNVKEGVLCIGYKDLPATSEKGRSRIQQIRNWCGPDFDGLIIFDQYDRAKELRPETGNQMSAVANAVLELQVTLPQARVVYCLGSGVSEPRHLACMPRLGLWGAGTAFPDFIAFLGAMEKRGAGALQLVAMDLKARGVYVSRALSFQGAELELIEVPLEAKYNEVYSRAAQFWGELRLDFMGALEALGDPKKAQQLWRAYWATRERFFRCLYLSAKVGQAIHLAKAALGEGKCAIIGLQADAESASEEHEAMGEFAGGPKELLLKLVEEHYPVPKRPRPLPEEAEKGGQGQVTVSTRGRVRKRVTYEGFVEGTEGVDDVSGSEGSVSEESDCSEGKFCSICKKAEGPALVECHLCRKTTHPACFAPPVTPPQKPEGWLCPPCEALTQEIKAEQKAYHDELSKRHEIALKRKAEVLEAIQQMELPRNPLDFLVAQLGGADAVAEMTGRRGVLAAGKEQLVWHPRNSSGGGLEATNENERVLFVQGGKVAAVVSETASPSVVLHSDCKAASQRRRVLISLELPLSTEKFLQHVGRVHRTNQASPPEIKVVYCGLAVEKRVAFAAAAKLQHLGATVKAPGGAGLSSPGFGLDSPLGRRALASFYSAVMEQLSGVSDPPTKAGGGSSAGGSTAEFHSFARAALIACNIIQGATAVPDGGQWRAGPWLRSLGRIATSDLTDVRKFFDRIRGLETPQQNVLSSALESTLEETVRRARGEGQWDAGIADVSTATFQLMGQPTEVYKDRLTGARTLHSLIKVDRGLRWEVASQLLAEAEAQSQVSENGFYYSLQQNRMGLHHFVLALERPGPGPRMFTVYRPSTGKAARGMSWAELQQHYVKAASGMPVEAGWSMEFESLAYKCMHEPNCRWMSACSVGRRVVELHLLSGLLLPFWSILESALSQQERPAHRRLRLVQVDVAGEKRRLVGVQVPSTAIGMVLQGLKEARVARR